MTIFLQQYAQEFIETARQFFLWYNSISRGILDFFHGIFKGMFDVLLFTAIIMSVLYLAMALYTMLRKNGRQNPTDSYGELPFVTVQIPTFNELVALRCARSCLNFDYPKDKYEVLIGDDSNNPNVSKKLREFVKEHNMVRIIKRKSNIGYKPGNLNNMLKHSKGSILVIFDSDFVPPQDFLAKIVQPFIKDEKVAGVQARWKFLNPSQNMITVLGTTIVSTFHHITIPFMHRSRNIAFLCGSAEAVRKSTLTELGGWDNGNFTEDIEYSLRLLKNGYKIEYLDSLECDGEVPFTLKDLYRQQMRWAYGVIHSWKKHFKDINKSKQLDVIGKFYIDGILCSGYLLSLLLAGLFITGFLSFITHAPAPIDWGEFLYKLARNILLTSGLIVTSFIALVKANNGKLTLPMVASSFSYGLVVTYFVNIGIFKALAKTPMEWYMLNKQGNKLE